MPVRNDMGWPRRPPALAGNPRQRRDYPAALRAVLFVNPTTVASRHRKHWTRLKENSVAVASAPMTTRFPVFGALREREPLRVARSTARAISRSLVRLRLEPRTSQE